MLKKLVVLQYICLIFFLVSCNNVKKSKEISLEKTEEIKLEVAKEAPLRIAIGNTITQKEAFAYYKPLIDYIGKRLEKPVKIVVKESYAEINRLMGLDEIDVAFLSSKAYVDGYDDYKIQILAVPQIKGVVEYSYIIVPISSPIKNFKELQGKTFAFVDSMSNTGKLVPHSMLTSMGEKPDFYFKKYIYTYAHDNSIKMVAQNIVDGAAVSSVVWEYLNQTDPELTAKTKIIEKSPPYAMPPVVIRPNYDPEMKKKLKKILLEIHNDEKGKEILNKMKIDKFVPIANSAYDSIRKLKEWIME
ncbi:MAG: phosphate/phosphite/phosphonate ABC transporter substrate-binding protein [bacterium]|nr:phosphate/phosphite/phosphonate ABC transporter substrate-binding protein [bacterium]